MTLRQRIQNELSAIDRDLQNPACAEQLDLLQAQKRVLARLLVADSEECISGCRAICPLAAKLNQ